MLGKCKHVVIVTRIMLFEPKFIIKRCSKCDKKLDRYHLFDIEFDNEGFTQC